MRYRLLSITILASLALLAAIPAVSSSQVQVRMKAAAPEPDELSIFPASNPWNTDISAYPVHPNSTNFLTTIGLATGLHPDFGTVYNGAPNGIPYSIVSNGPLVPITFTAYGNQSDPGPYPIPASAQIEGGPSSTGDRHVLVVDTARRRLYELYRAFPITNPAGAITGWNADSGAVFDLTSNALRPEGWTSADAAGLPIYPGLVRYDEAVTPTGGVGQIRHAIRFTAQLTQRGYIHPATHFASSSTNANRPPMGLRVRLRASFDITTFPAQVRPMLQAMKTYGMFLADNGSNWYVSGAPDPRWNEDDIHTLSRVHGSDFECVDTGAIIH
jgi:hypothetical protein